ncbi:helix-turn-helix domain-containing protein [Deinococcus alpinitundrae]|uniref:helix-turn-helix domain-containing protein n=1 Tax=Deinococcus alpinitundrae TaxID=468913 RepID=UPI00137951F6
MDFIATLRAAREERCLSSEAVARTSGLHPQTIRKAESGSTTRVTVESLRAWAKALDDELVILPTESGEEMQMKPVAPAAQVVS